MADLYTFTNNAFSTLLAGIGASATTFSVESGDGDLFPDLDGSTDESFMLYLIDKDDRSVYELVKCTVRVSGSDSFTVERAQEGTTARAFSLGDKVRLRITAGILENFIQKASHQTYAGDPTGNVTPNYIGEECLDTTNETFYIATGTTSSDWKAMTS